MNLDEARGTMTVEDVKTITNKAIYFGFGLFALIFLSMTTCTMHSNTYDPERLREEVAIKKVEVELAQKELEIKQQQNANEAEKLKIIERLVKNGINPIAARCAVIGKGWNNKEDIGCVIAAANNNNRAPIKEARTENQ